jgi:hypothetical protein
MAIYLRMFFIAPYAIILMKGLLIKAVIIPGKNHTLICTHIHTQIHIHTHTIFSIFSVEYYKIKTKGEYL